MTATDTKGPLLGIRHLQTFLIFLNIVVVYASRLNVAVAVVAMTNANTTNPDFPQYNWSEMEKSYILSSFFWGYLFTQFPGGYFSRRFGTKFTMFNSTFGTAISTLMIPLCVPWGGWRVFCGIRIIQGLFQGVMFPSIHAHLAKWSPPEERTRLGALSHTGVECGAVLAMGISGLIAAGPMGWPGISYVFGGLCLGWCVLWWAFADNNPPASKFISVQECQYIESSLNRENNFHNKAIPVPWKAIWTSVPFHALLIVRCAQAWGFTTIQAEIPTYMNGVLRMNIKNNALFSALPYVAMWVMSNVYLISSDVLMKKKICTLSTLRKTINTIALWVPAGALIAVGFLDERQKELAIALMILNVGVNGGATIGSSLNTLDLASNHAGILMGIVNTAASVIAILTPLVAGAIVQNEHDRTQWQVVFIISAVIFFFGNLIYIVWGIAEPQEWNAVDFMQPNKVEEPTKEAVAPRSSFVEVNLKQNKSAVKAENQIE